LEKQYDLIALRIPELGCEMLKLVSGNDRAKHAALWERPFEYYVWLAAIGTFPRQSCVRGRRTFAGVNCFCLIGRLTRVPSRLRGWSIIVVSTPNSVLGWQS